MLRSTESLPSYYNRLSNEELATRKKNLLKNYFVPATMWLLTAVLFFYAEMETELFIAYLVSVSGVIISLNADYCKRKKLIEDIISNRK